MAHCIIMDFEAATAAQYDAVIEEMELNGRLPAHALYHGAGSPDGRNWRVVDVWETSEDFERFAAEKIGPITARHGIGEPRITSFPVHEIRRSDPEPVTFLHVVRLRGIDAAGFAELDKKIGPEPAEGLIFHVNGPLDDCWATVGFWTAKAARDRFIQERIIPALAGAGEPPTIEDLELHNSLTEAAVGTAA
jgi:hypothetical protein